MREQIAEILDKFYSETIEELGRKWGTPDEQDAVIRKVNKKFTDQILALYPSSDELISGKERIAVWEAYKKDYPDPKLARADDAHYITMLLHAQARHTAQIKERAIREHLNWFGRLLDSCLSYIPDIGDRGKIIEVWNNYKSEYLK